jgi:MoxR-like ATPase
MNIKLLNHPVPEFDPERYIVDAGLQNAAEVAYALRQPLLLMGEPGTGKTRFAQKLAYELARKNAETGLGFFDKPLVFNTKTNSAARDLFYTYDALAHFQNANIRREAGQTGLDTADFINLQALGKAIAMTNPAAVTHPRLREGLEQNPRSTVVLIDEIDKAPRDFPNDILHEIDHQEFTIRELNGLTFKRNDAFPIMVVMTSNSEKNLPDAFLRRCVFYHIPFPEPEQLMTIAKTQLGEANQFTDAFLSQLIERFGELRKRAARKAPGTAEFIAWLRILGVHNINNLDTAANKQKLRDNLAILIKSKEDLDAVSGVF